MHFSEIDLRYLSGQDFSNGYTMQLSPNPCVARIDAIISIVPKKKVIHFGCCDHIPLIMDKIKDGRWLQKRLEDNCEKVIGIDINQEAVSFVRDNQLSQNVYCANILEDDISPILDDVYDYIVMGEILEHVDNPVAFLQQLKTKLNGHCRQILITVPYAINAIVPGSKRGTAAECINSDHRYWFTPYTLAKVMVMAGISPTELLFVDNSAGRAGAMLEKFGYRSLSESRCFNARTLLAVGTL